MISRQVLEEEQFSWYETSLPLMERKKRGHFSTPPQLVDQILDACGYTPAVNLATVRVLDPACGSGNFLADAARRLLAFGVQQGLSSEDQAALLSSNLWGLDPDPISCFLAEMQLRAILENTDLGNVGTQFIAPDSMQYATLAGTIRGHPIPPDDLPELADESAVGTLKRPLHFARDDGEPVVHAPCVFNIHQADSLALPWEPCIDLLVANPPYLAAKNTDLSGYRLAQQRGQVDSYLLFLNLALQVVRPEGWIGLVLPDPILARANATKERTRLLQEFTLQHLWHFSGVFTAEVGAVVIIAQKSPSKSLHQVSWIREQWQRVVKSSLSNKALEDPCGRPLVRSIAQSIFLRQPGAEFRYLLSSEEGVMIEHLRRYVDEAVPGDRYLAPLEEFVTICRGEELGRESPHLLELTQVRRQGELYPLLRGGIDIQAYGALQGSWGIKREAIMKPLERYLTPKLLVVKSTDRLQAAVDIRGHVALQTLYLLHLRDKNRGWDDLYFFLALLNSRLLQNYVYLLHTAYKWVQPQIEQHVLARLPIPIAKPEERRPIIERAKCLVRACSEGMAVVEWKENISRMYEEQERAICALYRLSMFGDE